MTDHVVDGVTVVHAEQPGPTTVNLMFRVGQGDERLTERGITHLLEHLALFPLGIRDHHANGQTGIHITSFHATGTPAEAVSFLVGVCDALADLPVGRLESEKVVLRTEASQRAAWTFADLAVWRHGPTSDGRSAYPEWGRDQVTPEQLLAWRDRHMTAGNAVLLVHGPALPDDLRLSLPPGPRQPVPPFTSNVPSGRSYFAAGHGAVLFDAVVERSTEATLVAQVLNKLMYQELRLDGAFSYTAGCGYQPRDASLATITGYADALDEQADALQGALIDLLARVRRGCFADELVTEAVAARLDDLDTPTVAAGLAASGAFDLLVGAERLSIDDYRTRLSNVRPDTIRQTAAQVMGDLLLQVPRGRRADGGGYTPLPVWSAHRVTAATIHPDIDGPGAFHAAPDGVSRVEGEDSATVDYASCAVCLAWPDGRRVLIGEDGFVVTIEPNLVERGQELVEIVDRDVDSSVVVVQPARDLADIPPVPQVPITDERGWLKRRRRRSA